MPGPVSRDQTVPVRRVAGRYALRGEIGRGGMASVHRAVDVVLEREVAVKLPHAHLSTDDAFLDRFRREARAAAGIDHPNVVAVHDWGEDPDEGAYLVLQLVDGPSLREILRRRGRLDPATAAAVLRPAAAGLGAAHSAGFVHRDVKPENLLIGRDGTVRVTDFGLARAAASATSTFGADVLVGSPHYLAPEAVRGRPLDPRADVYALGVVLFECLTGRPPHEGDSPYATAMAHTHRAVPAPSEAGPDVDPTLDDLVLAATAIDPDDRPDHGAWFATELATLVPGWSGIDLSALSEEVTGPPPPPARTGATIVLPDEDRATEIPAPPHAPPAPTDGHGGARERNGVEASAADPGHRPDVEEPAPPEPGAPVVDRPGAQEVDAEEGEPGAGGLRRPRRRRRWLVGVLVVLALLLASAAGGYLLWDRVLAPITPIPDVQAAGEEAAIAALVGAGFEVRVAGDQPFDLDVPAGHVLSQDPTGEARVGTIVTLVLSAGPRQVEVPDVVGDPVADAEDRLGEAGLTPSARAEAHHEEVPEGHVVAVEPAPGEVVDEASEVSLLVSLGPQPIDVPDVRGEALDTARSQLEDRGLRLEVTGQRYDGEAPAGTVVEQEPDPGATRFRGDAVAVVVSDGPEPVEIPAVRGEHVRDAITQLEGAGLAVHVEWRGGFGAFLNPGRVFDQDPGPGATRLPGETVTLYAYEE